ncbi:MAG: hypothetical protein V4481_03195 [Patescibacteria group bacterium]
MNAKHLIWLGAIVGGYVGGFIPVLWGAGGLTFSSIIGNTIGGLVGIWAGFKLSQMVS